MNKITDTATVIKAPNDTTLIPMAMLLDTRLSAEARGVMCAIYYQCNDKGEFDPHAVVNMHPNEHPVVVRCALEELRDFGYIEYEGEDLT